MPQATSKYFTSTEITVLDGLGTDGAVVVAALDAALDAADEALREWIINRLKRLANGG